MADTLTPEQRSAQMSRIRGSDTKLELLIRRGLHARGLRYRLGGAGLPGRPDLVFPRYATVLFVDGCFWHGHDCHLFRLPKTRTDFWNSKISANKARDARADVELQNLGWRPLHIWECEMRGKNAKQQARRIQSLDRLIRKRQAPSIPKL